MPNAAPDTTVQDSRASTAAMSPATCAAVRRRRTRADHRHRTARTASSSRSGPRHHSPIGHPAALVQVRRAGRGRPAPRGHSASPGTTNRIPRAAAVSSSRAGSTDVIRSARSSPELPVRGLLAQARRARSGRRARAPGRSAAGRPGSPIRESATRASRSASGRRRVPLTRRPARVSGRAGMLRSSSGVGRAQPQRHVELLDAGLVDAGEVGHRPRDPVHPHGAAPGQPAGVHLVVEPQPSPGRSSGQRSRSSGPGRVHVEPPGHVGVALPLPLARRRDPHPDRRARSRAARTAGPASSRVGGSARRSG